jgi:hypothetical protein
MPETLLSAAELASTHPFVGNAASLASLLSQLDLLARREVSRDVQRRGVQVILLASFRPTLRTLCSD